ARASHLSRRTLDEVVADALIRAAELTRRRHVVVVLLIERRGRYPHDAVDRSAVAAPVVVVVIAVGRVVRRWIRVPARVGVVIARIRRGPLVIQRALEVRAG